MISIPKRQRIWKTAALTVFDFVFVWLGIWVAYLIRYQWFDKNFAGIKFLPAWEYNFFAIILSFLVVLCYSFLGLYEIRTRERWPVQILKLGLGILIILFFLITFFFFFEYRSDVLPNGVPISRFIMASGGLASYYFVLLGRGVAWFVEELLFYFQKNRIKVVVIGGEDADLLKFLKTKAYISEIKLFPELNERIFLEIKSLIENQEIGEIYSLTKTSKLHLDLAFLAERFKIDYIFSTESIANFEVFGLKALQIKNKVYLEIIHSKLDGWNLVFKRLFDIFFAFLFLIFFSWLYLLIAVLIKLDSKGPVFYLSERVSPNGKVFKIWKFRRLKQEFCTSENNKKSLEIEEKLIKENDIRKDGVLYKIKNDPRSTKIGAFLEKTSLDEIPQFFNVLKGDLSLVGPRPHQPREVAKYKNEHLKVLNIQPGITGLSQINGRSDISFDKEVKLDIHYLENWSLFLDFLILIKTPFVIIFKRHR